MPCIEMPQACERMKQAYFTLNCSKYASNASCPFKCAFGAGHDADLPYSVIRSRQQVPRAVTFLSSNRVCSFHSQTHHAHLNAPSARGMMQTCHTLSYALGSKCLELLPSYHPIVHLHILGGGDVPGEVRIHGTVYDLIPLTLSVIINTLRISYRIKHLVGIVIYK